MEGNKREKFFVGETPNGKKLFLSRDNYSDWFFLFEDGGQIPEELKGVWHKQDSAKVKGENYLASKYKEEIKKQTPSKKAS